jgi:hypothetical protein
VNSHVFNLSLGVNEMFVGLGLYCVLPMNNELLMLKVRENVVESCELWSGQECKVSKLSVSNEEAEKEFMLEDELLQPFVMTLRSEHSD